MTKPRALLDLLEIPNILEKRERAVNEGKRESDRDVGAAGAGLLQEGSVASCHSNVLQQLAGGVYRQVGGVPVQESVVGRQRVFVDAALGLDEARLVHRSSVTAFTFGKRHFESHSLLLLPCYDLSNVLPLVTTFDLK